MPNRMVEVTPSLDPNAVAWWKLATDGSYLVSGYASGLFVWSTADASLLFSRSGDYSHAQAFAGPGQVALGNGPAGANVIENDSVPGGTSTTSPATAASSSTCRRPASWTG